MSILGFCVKIFTAFQGVDEYVEHHIFWSSGNNSNVIATCGSVLELLPLDVNWTIDNNSEDEFAGSIAELNASFIMLKLSTR